MYKRGCRCDECRIANTAYEKKRREANARRKQPQMPVIKMPHDTLTREEFMKYRYGN